MVALSACSTISEKPSVIQAKDKAALSSAQTVYKGAEDLIKNEAENCKEAIDGWRFENVSLDTNGYILERSAKTASKKEKTNIERTFANLLCVTKIRKEEKILKIMTANKNFATEEDSIAGKWVIGTLPIQIHAYDAQGKEISVKQIRKTLTKEETWRFVEFQAKQALPIYLVVEVDSKVNADEALEEGSGDRTHYTLIRGSGVGLKAYNPYHFTLYPVTSGEARAEWVSPDSQLFQASQLESKAIPTKTSL